MPPSAATAPPAVAAEPLPTEDAAGADVGGDEHVRLNVGGVTFSTTKAALTTSSSSIFAAMFTSDMCPGDVDGAGAVIIQRPADTFLYVLRHLHGEDLQLADLADSGLRKLGIECDFYVLSELQETVRCELTLRETQQREMDLAVQRAQDQLQVMHEEFEEKVCYVVGFCRTCKIQTSLPWHCYGCGKGGNKATIRTFHVKKKGDVHVCTQCCNEARLPHHCDECKGRSRVVTLSDNGHKHAHI